ncbi:unnamed protein product [Strongylus vulgaris]|uniref:Uncharacterized protein n=1 Tax=Strongylus vulgaris TaxID=40348 RepID=A0A3P7JIG9_STRVU|nr:unnamed protein product [Strongylus vulgaris]
MVDSSTANSETAAAPVEQPPAPAEQPPAEKGKENGGSHSADVEMDNGEPESKRPKKEDSDE